MKKISGLSGRISFVFLILVTLLAVVSFYAGRITVLKTSGKVHVDQAEPAVKETMWTCSMHPQIIQPKFGKCPLCEMDLVPVKLDSSEGENPRVLKLSPMAVKIAEIRTMPVRRMFVDAEIRLSGRVEYDETRRKVIAARVPGRLDRLYVDYTGIPIKKGDHLVYIYSPSLLTAQQELLQALSAEQKLKNSTLESIRRTSSQTVLSVREKLRLLGLSREQIQNIEERGTTVEHMTIYSPLTGIIVHKNATEGMYVDTGFPIYTVADLSRVWVFLDAYETDLIWLRYGQEVEFETAAYPSEKFHGKIAFISPTLDSKTRTVKIRVNVENNSGKLKPDMFVKSVIHSRIADGGKIMEPDLAGKWISPMHPEIISSTPGKCTVCGMPLVRAETLGFVSQDKNASAPLVIPATAPMITGKRAIVYVYNEGDASYEGREIELGPRAGEFFIVMSGLSEGESVVVNGNFKLDSALQISGKPSMMSPSSQDSEGKRKQDMAHAEVGDKKAQTACPVMGGDIDRKHFSDYQGKRIYFCCPGCDSTFNKDPLTYLNKMKEMGIEPEKTPAPGMFMKPDTASRLFKSYFTFQKALAADDPDAAGNEKDRMVNEIRSLQIKELDEFSKGNDPGKKVDITQLREVFAVLSESLNAMLLSHPESLDYPVYRFQCPMAFNNRGAIWLQDTDMIANPYFGSAMLECGDLQQTFPGGKHGE